MTTPVTQSTGTTPSASSTDITNPTVDKNMFLSMLVAQMKNQNPMQPTDSTQWIGQMAQFSEVEQVSNMATDESKVAKALGVSQTESLLGRTVTYTDANGATQQGKVDRVDIAGDSATLEIDGQSGIDPSTVTQVQ
jgi:flagellar basal-body rod modification protein FlgD